MGEPREVKVFRQSMPAEPDAERFMPFAIEATPSDDDGGDGDRAPVSHEFRARVKPSAGSTFAIGTLIRFDERGRQVVDLNGILKFLHASMPRADYDRLADLVDDPDWFIDMDQIADVFMWLVEEYTGRPFERSRPSSRGAPKNGRGSTGPRSGKART